YLSSSDHQAASLRSAERDTPTDEAIAPSASAPRALPGDVEIDALRPPRPAWFAYTILLFGVICTALTTAYVTATSEAKDKGQFKASIESMQAVIADRLDADVAVLNAGAEYLAVRPKATPEDLRRTLSALQPRAHATWLTDIGVVREIPEGDPIRRAA